MTDSSSADVAPESSTGTSVVNETASTPVTPETTSEPKSVLDAVEAALKTDGVEAGSPPAGNRSEKTEAKPQEPAPKDDNGELSDEEKRQWSPRAQERLRGLAAQKNELKATVDRMTAETEPLKAKAASFEQITGYLAEKGVSAQEANNALELTALIKGQNYQKAMELLAPVYNDLVRRTGGVLDQDLREDVRLGHMPLQRAQEIQKGRANEATNREREESRTQREQRQQQDTERKTFETHVTTVARAADDWAKQKADSDPDWNHKADLVAAQVNVIITRDGFPKTVADAIKISEKALETVEGKLKPLRPAPKAITPARPQGSAQPRDTAQPKNALEALEKGLAAVRH